MNVQTSGIADRMREQFPEVIKARLSGPDGMPTPHYGLFNMTTGAGFGPAVKEQFVPHSTEDVIALCEAAEAAFGEAAEVDCGFNGGHHVVIQPSKQERLNVFDGGNDSCWPRLLIRGVYGECFRATVGYYRDACRNLAIMRQVSGTSVVIRHTSGLRSQMDDLIATFGSLQGGWTALSARLRQMEQMRVGLAAFLDRVYPLADDASEATVTRHRNRTEVIVRRIMQERVATGRTSEDLTPVSLIDRQTVSAFEAYNAVQGYAQHTKTRKGRVAAFDRAILAFSDPIVAAAERAAFEMAV